MSKLSNRSRRARSHRRAAFLLAVLALALHPGPAAAGGFFDEVWARLRFLWAYQGVQIDPSGRTAPASVTERGTGSAIWAEAGVEIDPSGQPAPAHVTTQAPPEQR
ncbi:MAG TPA: hypothetical protein VN783_05350 [Thermoanaerobaculia bacterium]|nr:hypothetical protein [Thermoanaerobaculia bacterium]